MCKGVKRLNDINYNSGVFLLLNANYPESNIYGRFEGTKFIVSSINPFILVHNITTFIVPIIAHDVVFHRAYIRKNKLSDINYNQFKIIVKQAKEKKYYPEFFSIIHQIFHEKASDEPFTIKMFLKELPDFVLQNNPNKLGHETSSLEVIGDSNLYKLINFLNDLNYISPNIYKKLCTYTIEISKKTDHTNFSNYTSENNKLFEEWKKYNLDIN